MTSMISPWAYASQLATEAQDRLAQASKLLRSEAPRPLQPPVDQIGIPEHNGPNTPDNPWYVGPTPIMPPYVHNSAAQRLAGGAVVAIDRALAVRMLSEGVTTAFRQAKQEAVAGVGMLTAGTVSSGKAVAPRFDAAGMWLGLAKNLLTLEHGVVQNPVRPPVVRPPVTILPVPDAEILPVKLPVGKPEPITIQLPSPDSPVQ